MLKDDNESIFDTFETFDVEYNKNTERYDD